MPLTYHVCSVAVHGEDVLTEFSSQDISRGDFQSTAVPSPAFDRLSGGVQPLQQREATPQWQDTCGAWGAMAAGVHWTLQWLLQSHRLRCFCTWNTPGVDSQTFLCFCFNCIKERSLWPVRCSMPTTLEEKDWRCCLHWLWEGISGSAVVLVCDSNLSEEPSLSFLNHCFPLILMPFWASISLQHYPTCMLPLPLHQAHINTSHWDQCSFAPAW